MAKTKIDLNHSSIKDFFIDQEEEKKKNRLRQEELAAEVEIGLEPIQSVVLPSLATTVYGRWTILSVLLCMSLGILFSIMKKNSIDNLWLKTAIIEYLQWYVTLKILRKILSFQKNININIFLNAHYKTWIEHLPQISRKSPADQLKKVKVLAIKIHAPYTYKGTVSRKEASVLKMKFEQRRKKSVEILKEFSLFSSKSNASNSNERIIYYSDLTAVRLAKLVSKK